MNNLNKLNKENFYKIAKIIDNNFNGSFNTFSCDKIKDCFYLTTNLCDNASIILIYFNSDYTLKEIKRLGEDTNGYENILPITLNRVYKYFESLEIKE